MAADERDDCIRIRRLDCFRRARVHPQRRRRGMNHDEVVVLGFVDRHLDRVVMRRRVEQACARNHPRRISQPRRIPERPNLARRLVARTRAPVEIIVRGRIKKKRLHHIHAKHTPRLSDWLVSDYTNRDNRRQQCAQFKLRPGHRYSLDSEKTCICGAARSK